MQLSKVYPKVVGMKKSILFTVIAVIVLLMFVVVFNTVHTFSKMKNPPPKKAVDGDTLTYATPQDTLWIKNSVPPPALQTVPKAKPVQPLTNAVEQKSPTIITAATPVAANANVQATPAFSNDDLKLIAAPISSNQLIPDTNDTASTSQPTDAQGSGQAADDNTPGATDKNDPNGQGDKKAFLKLNSTTQKDYIDSTVENPVSPYEVKATTVIPGVLVSGINSDLPGPISAQVTENVYDSRSGQNILIPQGAKLMGLYDSQIAFGQERVLVVWQRIIFPNGSSIDLQGMPGVDIAGLAGFHDQVNNHYGKLFSSVLLISVLSAGAQLSQPQQQFNNNSNGQLSINQILAQSLGTNIANAGTNLFQKDLDIQPTLQIRQGYQFNIMVTKDMVFPGPYQGG